MSGNKVEHSMWNIEECPICKAKNSFSSSWIRMEGAMKLIGTERPVTTIYERQTCRNCAVTFFFMKSESGT